MATNITSQKSKPMKCSFCDFTAKTNGRYRHEIEEHSSQILLRAQHIQFKNLTKADLIVLIGRDEEGKFLDYNTHKLTHLQDHYKQMMRIDQVQQNVDQVQKYAEQVQDEVEQVQQDIDQVQQNVDQVQQYAEQVQDEVEQVQQDIDQVQQNVDQVQQYAEQVQDEVEQLQQELAQLRLQNQELQEEQRRQRREQAEILKELRAEREARLRLSNNFEFVTQAMRETLVLF